MHLELCATPFADCVEGDVEASNVIRRYSFVWLAQ